MRRPSKKISEAQAHFRLTFSSNQQQIHNAEHIKSNDISSREVTSRDPSTICRLMRDE